jgi:hypothetical protein
LTGPVFFTSRSQPVKVSIFRPTEDLPFMLCRPSLMRFFCYCANSRESIGRYVVEVRKACLIPARTYKGG